MEHLDDMLGILLSGGCLEIALYYVEHLDDVLGILLSGGCLEIALYYVGHLDDMLRILLLVDVLIYRCAMWNI